MAQNDDPVVAKRRSFLQAIGLSAGLATLGATTAVSASEEDTAPMSYELPDLPYAYDALEPHIDRRIMELHHGTHHQGYVDGANAALEQLAEMREAGDFEGIKHIKRNLSFNLSGHVNHTVFWENMSPDGGGEPEGGLRERIKADFGSVGAFREEFTEAANAIESNGWAMLFHEPVADRLVVGQVESQNRLAHQDATPLLALDVWEHAYYLQYEADRDEYVEAWWNVVDWDDVARRCRAAGSGEDPY